MVLQLEQEKFWLANVAGHDIAHYKFRKGGGCQSCGYTGYKGRIGIHEIISPDNTLQKLMISNPSQDELTEYLSTRKIKTLFDDGMDRVKQGLTTIEEVERVANMEM